MASEALPAWIRVKADQSDGFTSVRTALRERGLRTVCDSAHCPNISECWRQKAATFMLLGRNCTRSCRFCAVGHGAPEDLDGKEPEKVAVAVAELGLRYAVLTSVTRDDLEDMGASHFAAAVSAIRNRSDATVEVLVPDLGGKEELVEEVLSSGPAVFGHNIEVVRRLQPAIRDGRASYDVSLRTLREAKRISPQTLTKTSLLLGLGETRQEILETMEEARAAGVDILVLGQYLRPRGIELPVSRYLSPEDFTSLAAEAAAMGFRAVVSAPLARTSYRAEEAYRRAGGQNAV
jgi:lipoic acid synthetase